MPVGSPLLPVLLNLIIHDLEKNVLFNMSINIPIYRYMDDILLLVPNQIYEILLNRLKFTVEHNDDSSVNFLNVKLTLTIKEDQIKFNNYS